MPTTYTPPRSDAYTGLLAISLGAMVIASVVLFLDFNQYDKKPAMPPTPKLRGAQQEQQPAAAPVIPPQPEIPAGPKDKQ
jgi:hypothetical protein